MGRACQGAHLLDRCPRNRMVAMRADRVSERPRPRIEVCVCVYSPVQASPISVPLGFLDALEPGFVDLLAANHEADGPTERGPGQRGGSAKPQFATHRRRAGQTVVAGAAPE
jgi:hypothetical protein